MWKIVRIFAVVDDATRRKTEHDVHLRRGPHEKPKEENYKGGSDNGGRGWSEWKGFPSRLTPFMKSRTKILNSHKDMFKNPPQLQSPPHKRDKSKWCQYHIDHGHVTETCKDLINEIEDCVKNEQLR